MQRGEYQTELALQIHFPSSIFRIVFKIFCLCLDSLCSSLLKESKTFLFVFVFSLFIPSQEEEPLFFRIRVNHQLAGAQGLI